MQYSEDIDAYLDILLTGIDEHLGDRLAGVYLRGSLAAGDFDPESSDIDVMAVTTRPVNDEEFDALAALHADMDTLPNLYAGRLEIAYVDRNALRRFRPGQRHPTLGQGESLVWLEHGSNWILERWTLREHGIVLRGPEPQELIDAISDEEIRSAILERLPDWAEWAQDVDDPEWALHLGHKAYVVETMCRALYAISQGTLPSKPQAVAWARTTVQEPWRSTVVRSATWHNSPTFDQSVVPEVRAFVLWVCSLPEIE